jgi:hypothetical protein
MISYIGIVISYVVLYNMTTLDIVLRYNRMEITLLSNLSLLPMN